MDVKPGSNIVKQLPCSPSLKLNSNQYKTTIMQYPNKVQFNDTDAQVRRVKSAAKKAKMSISEWLRQAVKAALKK